MKIYFADKTNYSEIFEKTYWGQFIYFDNNTGYECDNSDIPIFENRNKFITKYNISSIKEYPPQYITKNYINRHQYEYVDHAEVYEDKNKENYIIIISPYRTLTSDELEEVPWKKIEKLYDHRATTYMIVISKKTKNINFNYIKNLK